MKIEWILPDSAMQDKIAHEPGVPNAVNKVAREKAAIARGYLMAHRVEGHAHIDVTRGVTDSFVNLNDKRSRSNNYAAAAAAIEFGRSGEHPTQGVRALSRAFGLTSGPRRQKNSGRAAGRPQPKG
jgi:hypothetical protein